VVVENLRSDCMCGNILTEAMECKMPRLTKKSIESVIVDPSRPVYLWDELLPAFGVKVLSSGVRKYILKYRVGAGGRTAAQRWLTLGQHGALTPDQARGMAQQALATIANGEDPQGQKSVQRAAPRLFDVWARFESEQLPRRKVATGRDYQQLWRDFIEPSLGNKLVNDITREMIDRLHKKRVSTPYSANRTLALLSRLFSLAETWGMRMQGTNPCKGIERYKEHSRERYLTAKELGRLGAAIEKMLNAGSIYPEAVAAIRLLLLTGARRSEILTARWDWVARESRLIMLPDSKTGKKNIYLSNDALKVLDWIKEVNGEGDSPYILPGKSKGKPLNNLSKSWHRLCTEASLDGVRLHDLRHTAASIAVGQGASLSLIGRLLGHSQAQTTMRYAHVDADPTLKLADELGTSVTAALGSKVVLPD
jgi:integrase